MKAKPAAAKRAPAAKPTTENETMNKPKDNAFMSAGVDALFAFNATDPNEFEIVVNLDDIEIEDQERTEFEDEHQSLAELGKSLRKHQIQAILLRPNRAGREKPYLLVAGERRVRGAQIEGIPQLRARVKDMTDEEAHDLRFAENIHRKNLTQIEEAKRIQRELDQLGSVEAVLEKHHKSRAWLSKVLALLTLPEQAKRLVTENVSADLEVINTVKTIEKADPEAAKELVDELKATRGKANAREKAATVKEKVKPSKKPKADKKTEGGTVATLKDRSHEEPGQVSVFADAKTTGDEVPGDFMSEADRNQGEHGPDPFADDQGEERRPVAFSPAQVLNQAYTNIFEFDSSPKTVLDVMSAEDKEAVDAWLRSFYDAGVTVKDLGRAVIQGFRNGQFSSDGEGAFALVAFLQGADSEAKYSLLNVFGSVKA